MKQIIVFFIAVLLVSTSFAQVQEVSNNNSKAVIDTLNYAGANNSGYGIGIPNTMGIFTLHPATEMTSLVGNYITEVRFFINEIANVASIEIQLYNDTTTAVFTQTATVLVDGWNTVVLNPSYPITADQLYVGYEIEETGMFGKPIGIDAGPRQADGYGDIIRVANWTTANDINSSLDFNWNIETVVGDAPITCFPPSAINISNITANSANITWNSTASAWNIKISSTNIDPTITTGDIYDGATTTAAYNVAGLTGLSEYYIYVQSDCGALNTSAWISSSFTTDKDCSTPFSAPWLTDFNEGIDCWTLYDSDGDGNNWEASQLISLGNYSLNSYSRNFNTGAGLTPDNWAVTNKIDISELTTPNLSWTVRSIDEDYPTEHYTVYISTTGNTIADFANPVVYQTLTNTNTITKNIDLETYPDSIWVAFRHHITVNMSGIIIDDIKVNNDKTISINSNTGMTNNFTIFPNPAKDKISISNAEGEKIVILDISGKIIFTIEKASKLQEVNISNFAAGTYIVKINSSVSKFNVMK